MRCYWEHLREHIERRQKPKCPKLECCFCDGPSKDAHHKRKKKLNFGDPCNQLIWFKKKIRGCSSSPPPMTSPRRK
jgi:hypothetical protein